MSTMNTFDVVASGVVAPDRFRWLNAVGVEIAVGYQNAVGIETAVGSKTL